MASQIYKDHSCSQRNIVNVVEIDVLLENEWHNGNYNYRTTENKMNITLNLCTK